MRIERYALAAGLSLALPLAAEAGDAMPSNPVEKKIEISKVAGEIKPGNKILDPHVRMTAPAGATRVGEEYVLNEDFEAWKEGTNDNWLPEGWSVDRVVKAAGHAGWQIYAPKSMYDPIPSQCMFFNGFDDPVDEWLITPEVEVTDGMLLSFYSVPSPLYYYDPDYIDYEKFEFTEKHILNDFRVNVSEDGGETWTLLKSMAEDYLDVMSYFDLYYLMFAQTFTIDLSEYYGKKVKIAFQVEGLPEGNSVLVDNVYIGYPALEVSYKRPEGALFFGLSSTDEYLPASILTVPVYEQVVFKNNSSSKADFVWTYEDTEGEKTSDDQKQLSVTYLTDYTDDFSTRNNLYDMPVLTGSADKHATTEFSYPYWLQAGGKGEYERHYIDTDEREIVDLGLGVIDPVTEGTATYADIALPYFGFNHESDRFWTNDMLNGDKDLTLDEDNYCRLVKNGNLFYATDAPLVINGVRANGYGKVSRDARFTAEIYLIGKNWVIPDEPYATAVCTGDDITIIDRYASNYILSLNFKFDEPIVMSKDLTPYYFVAIGGFHDEDNVEYYSPEMSERDNPEGLALGWIAKEMRLMGRDFPISWSAVASYTESKVGFYIMLDAVFPWLMSETDNITVSKGETVEVKLDSYYDGSQLKIENLPAWLSAMVEGRYGETFVKFTATDDVAGDAAISITAPGVSKTITVTNSTGSVGSIDISDLKGEETVYTLTGIRVNKNSLKPGIYIIKDSEGNARKSYLK